MENINETINCLDKGYITLTRVDGKDIDVVNSARVSFDKAVTEMSERDIRLINFLAREKHMSPFRQVGLQFEVYAPLMIARQWWKYKVGGNHQMDAWNESSRRYITENEEFYIPQADEWRSYPDNVKQGSGEPVGEDKGMDLTTNLTDYIELGERLYNEALELGIAPEQARLFLPSYGMYVRWRWKASLESILHVVEERTADDAQYEFRIYADALLKLTTKHFPHSTEALLKYKRK